MRRLTWGCVRTIQMYKSVFYQLGGFQIVEGDPPPPRLLIAPGGLSSTDRLWHVSCVRTLGDVWLCSPGPPCANPEAPAKVLHKPSGYEAMGLIPPAGSDSEQYKLSMQRHMVQYVEGQDVGRYCCGHDKSGS
jgi:hypothetical protein